LYDLPHPGHPRRRRRSGRMSKSAILIESMDDGGIRVCLEIEGTRLDDGTWKLASVFITGLYFPWHGERESMLCDRPSARLKQIVLDFAKSRVWSEQWEAVWENKMAAIENRAFI
jgi:hypothetical protein